MKQPIDYSRTDKLSPKYDKPKHIKVYDKALFREITRVKKEMKFSTAEQVLAYWATRS